MAVLPVLSPFSFDTCHCEALTLPLRMLFFLSFFFLFLKSYLSKLSNNARKIEKQSASIDYVN